MSHHLASYHEKKRRERRERVERSGNKKKIDDYKKAEKRGDMAALKLGGSIVTKNPVGAGFAGKEMYDAHKEKQAILDSLDD